MSQWSGLGIGWFSDGNGNNADGLASCKANIGVNIRMDIPTYTSAAVVAYSKVAVLQAVALGMNVVWGVSSNSPTTITSTTWTAFRQAILDAAQWAQDNGVYEFQIGNEEEYHNDNTTITDATLFDNLRTLATDVQAIFTRGNVSYATGHDMSANWISNGLGGLDLLSSNIYRGYPTASSTWQTELNTFVSNFGNKFWVSEFNLSSGNPTTWSADEQEQAYAIQEMIDYMRSLSIPRAYFFAYNGGSTFGVSGSPFKLMWVPLIQKRRFLTKFN